MSTIVPFFTHLCSAPKSSTLLACSLRFSYSERNASALLTESVLNCCGSGRITRVLGSTKIAVLIVGFITTPNLRGASPSSRINFSRMSACRLACSMGEGIAWYRFWDQYSNSLRGQILQPLRTEFDSKIQHSIRKRKSDGQGKRGTV